jgi:hypothetical protein
MKSTILRIRGFIYLGMIVVMVFSCENETVKNNNFPCNEPYEIVESLNGAEGIIGYDKINKQYVINIHVVGTIDEMKTVYPCQLAEAYPKVNLKVKVSGNLFLSDKLPNPILGGQTMFHIDLNDISTVNN